jgi:hypothetical protein
VDVWSDEKRQNEEHTDTGNCESGRGIEVGTGSKAEVIWARIEDRGGERGEKGDGHGGARTEKKMKT